jgi:hypothetical protein
LYPLAGPDSLTPTPAQTVGGTARDALTFASTTAAALANRATMVGVARHYGQEYRFTVYSKAWLDGLGTAVARLRATGTAVVVLGPTPLPSGDVPECLAGHLSGATACGRPLRDAVDSGGAAAERRAVTTAGGSYLDVSRWVCGPRVCPPMVGDLLVYRDTNHLTTSITGWLTPVLGAALAPAWPAP